MCIIVAKKAGTALPKKATLQNCFDNNPDGAGYMFNLHDKIVIKKGYTQFESFYNDILTDYKKYNLFYKNVVMHFRIATSGGITPAKTHPYPITDDEQQLNQLDIITQYGVAHNGVLSNFTYNKKLNDSQTFIKDFLYNILKIDKNFLNNKYIEKIILHEIGSSKLAILHGKQMHLYGEFTEEAGVYYSNTTYKYKKYNYYSTAWDDWDDWEIYNYNYYKNYVKNKTAGAALES